MLPVWIIGTDRMGWVARNSCTSLTVAAANLALIQLLAGMHVQCDNGDTESEHLARECEHSCTCVGGL